MSNKSKNCVSKRAPGVTRLNRRDILQNIVKYTGKPRYRQMAKQCITGIPTAMFHNEIIKITTKTIVNFTYYDLLHIS